MIIKKSKIESISKIGDDKGEFSDLLNSKYSPQSRIIIDDNRNKLIIVSFLSHENTQIEEKITFEKYTGNLSIVIHTTEPENNKGADIIVQVILECKNYKEITSQIINKNNIFIGIRNLNKMASHIRFGGLPTDPIPTFPPK